MYVLEIMHEAVRDNVRKRKIESLSSHHLTFRKKRFSVTEFFVILVNDCHVAAS